MAILHDYMENTDGGSRLCLHLAKGLDTALVFGFMRKNHPFLEEVQAPAIHCLCQHLNLPLVSLPLVRQYLLAKLFLEKNINVKTVLNLSKKYTIYSGTYAPLAVKNRIDNKNILYCHTPPRFLFDAYMTFYHKTPPVMRFLFERFCHWLRPQYEEATKNMDIIIANSYAVQERIQQYLHLPSVVINPPCAVEQYTYDTSQGYYLSMVRLDALKRVDLLIAAFANLPYLQLVISSTGSEETKLKKMAAQLHNVSFTGVISEKKRRALLAGCTATICVAKSEDFGMCAVESLAAGKPVIIAQSGGLQEIITHEETGICLNADPCPDDIIQSILYLTKHRAERMQKACQACAQKYDVTHFVDKIKMLIE